MPRPALVSDVPDPEIAPVAERVAPEATFHVWLPPSVIAVASVSVLELASPLALMPPVPSVNVPDPEIV